MSKSSQRKGANAERELASLLHEHGFEVERGGSLTFGGTPDIVGLPGVHIECKRVERLIVLEAYQQSVRDAERFRDGMPAVFHRRNRSPWLVTMSLSDWLELYNAHEKRGV